MTRNILHRSSCPSFLVRDLGYRCFRTTRTRIDLGLALKDTKVPKRLINTGGLTKKDRITHRIKITSLRDIDAEVKKWLKTAYEMDR